ncbi:MAG: dihydroxyacetone kinase subunit DhaL [Streptosporangiaceae bacterium]
MGVTADRTASLARRYAALVADSREELTRLDAAVGDADHGENLDRGMRAVVEALDADTPDAPAGVLTLVGRTLVSRVGGASGALYGTAFLRAGKAAGDRAELEPADVVAVLEAARDGIAARGKAKAGDKTMYDAWVPAVEAVSVAVTDGKDLAGAFASGSAAAERAVKEIVPLVARRGRASYLGERSAGHRDPGSVSTALLCRALAEEAQAGCLEAVRIGR